MVTNANQDNVALLDRLRLQLVPGVGPRVLQLLLEHVGGATEILATSRHRLLEVPHVGHNVADGIVRAISRGEAREIVDRCRCLGISLVERGDPAYSCLLYTSDAADE